MRRLFGLILFMLCTSMSLPLMAAEPSLQEVYQAANSGQLARAESMMAEVLKQHPQSARAHYVEADLLARQGHLAQARAELQKAEQLAPGLPFVKADAVQSLRQQLNATSHPLSPASSSSSHWSMTSILLGVGVVVAVLMFIRGLMARRNDMGSRLQPSGAGPYAMPYGNGATGAPASSGMGSGILGGLATGAALGAGMVAGEALMHRVLDGRTENERGAGSSDGGNVDDHFGGNNFGITDDNGWDGGSSSWDDGGSSIGSDDWN